MPDPFESFMATPLKGIMDRIDANKMPSDALMDAWNITMREPAGAMTRRKGAKLFSSTADAGLLGNTNFNHTAPVVAMTEWISTDTRYLIAIVKTGVTSTQAILYANQPDTSTTWYQVGAAFNVGKTPPTFAAMNSLLYIATGSTDANANLVLSEGLSTPTAALTASDSATAGIVTAGTHSYVYTFYNATTGAESIGSIPSNTITAVGNTKASFSGATALPTGADHYRLYRTAAGGSNYLLLGAFTTLTTNTDNVADASLGTAGPPPFPVGGPLALNVSVGLPAPTAALTASQSATAGVVTAGNHLWTYTFYNSVSGAESLQAPVSNTGTPLSMDGVHMASFSGATSLPSGADSYNLYRTAEGGTQFRLVGQFASISTNTDNVSDANLGYAEPPPAGGPPFTCSCNCVHQGYMLWGGKTDAQGQPEPNLIYPSQPGQPGMVSPLDGIAVERDDGDTIQRIVILADQPFVIKKNNTYRLLPDTNLIYTVSSCIKMGTTSPGTVATYDRRLFYLAKDGIVMSSGCQAGAIKSDVTTTVYKRETMPTVIRFDYQNTAAPTQTVNFKVSFYSDPAMTDLVGTFSTTVSTNYWTLDGGPFPSDGVIVEGGNLVQVHLDPRSALTLGNRYYVQIQSSLDDGMTWGLPMDFYTIGGYVPNIDNVFSAEVNWSLADQFFGFVVSDRTEYWCCVASNNSSYIDTIWVFNWTDNTLMRYTGFLSAGCATTKPLPNDAEPIGVLAGDYDGVIWKLNGDTDTERDLVEVAGPRVGTGTITGTGPWTLTDGGLWFPFATGGYNVLGLRGTQVVLVDQYMFRYTGIITANDDTSLTISNWLLGRVPPAGTYNYYISGMDASFVSAWFSMDDPIRIKQIKMIYADIDAVGEELMVEARYADSPDELSMRNFLNWRRAVVPTLDTRSQAQLVRIPYGGRCRFASVKMGNVSAGQPFSIKSFGFGYMKVGSVK